MTASWSASLRSGAALRLAVTVKLGADRAQPLGTLAQLRKPSGEVVAGLGFPQVMNHFARTNPRLLSGFVRADAAVSHQSIVLGSATKVRYRLGVFDGELIDLANRERFDPDCGEWLPLQTGFAGLDLAAGEGLYSLQRVGCHVFAVTTQRVLCDGVTIYSHGAPGWGACAYYRDGWLHVCCPGYGEIRSFAWQPGQPPVGAPALTYTLGPHYGRALAVLGGQTFMITHAGGLHRFDGSAWSTLQWSFNGEFYCLAQVGETLRLGDYGTGDQWLYDPAASPAFAKLADNPPAEAGSIKSNGREVQSFALHGGMLYHGVYPWGHVHWRDLLRWSWGYRRLFSGPPVSGDFAPFHAELTARGVPNDFPGRSRWGQRVTSLVPWRGGVAAAVANIEGSLDVPAGQGDLVNGLVAEYGRVHLIEGPPACSAEISWTDQPTELALEASATGTCLLQDGQPLASGPGLSPGLIAAGDLSLDVGRGLFGTYGGESIRGVAVSA